MLPSAKIKRTKMWTLSGSNRSPPACKAGALPNELRAQFSIQTWLKIQSLLWAPTNACPPWVEAKGPIFYLKQLKSIIAKSINLSSF